MKAKTYSYKGRLYSEIPAEAAGALRIKSGDEIEFKTVYDNLVLIVPSKAEPIKTEVAKTSTELTAAEIELLQKINEIRHYDRTYDNVSKMLEAPDRKMFESMFKRGVMFEYKKAGKELMGIDKNYFKYIMGEKHESIERLITNGYMVLEDQAEAKQLNDMLKRERLDVRGIRGFDKRYYIMSAEKLNDIENKLNAILAKEKALKTISLELGLSEDLCKASLEILREDGKIVEKRKNMYVLA